MAGTVHFVVTCTIALICTVLLSSTLGLERRDRKPSSSTESTEESGGLLWRLFSRGREFLSSFQFNKNYGKDSTDPHRIISTGQRLGGIASGDIPGEMIYDDPEQPEHREVIEYNHDHGYHQNSYETKYTGGHSHTTKVIYRGDNMELYSLLGGLSFASLLATTLIILTRRNGTLLRSSDASTIFRNVDASVPSEVTLEPYEVRLKIPKALVKMGKLFWKRPVWWSNEGRSDSRELKGVKL